MATLIDTLKTRLTAKITTMLLVALVFALSAIGYTLWLSWQLEGAAAAINDSGSLRMRAWKIAAIINHTPAGQALNAQDQAIIQKARTAFEQTLAELHSGDPQRPLFLPRQTAIQQQLLQLEQNWQQHFAPQLDQLLAGSIFLPNTASEWQRQTIDLVDSIHQTVNLIEKEYARQTFWLRSSQMMLIVMALIGTLVMVILLHLMIVRPVTNLHQGLQQMTAGDFNVRLPIEGHDEFAQLTAGFNAMANELQQLYVGLEQRVAEKTERLAQKNRHLSVLYDISQHINRHQSLEELCRNFLQRIVPEFDAAGGTVRLIDKNADRVYLVVDEGIPPSLSQQMQCQTLGSCFCSTAAKLGKTAINNLDSHFSPHFSHCLAAGFKVVLAIPIQTADKNYGIFNLHFSHHRDLEDDEKLLMETLGQQLGVAIGSQRLTSHEKELAIIEERNLVAQGLHDSIVQSLSFLNIQLQLLQNAVKNQQLSQIEAIIPLLKTGVQQGYEDLRELMGNFRTRYDDSQLEAAIAAVIRRFTEQSQIPVTLTVDNSGQPLANNERLQILFILQEALSNIRKHAQCTQVKVRALNRANFDLTIEDNGIGFDPQQVQSTAQKHIGLNIMQERASRIHAQFDIHSQLNQGTTIKLHLSQEQRQKA
ncbi:MAG: type IV pili methyl-accepting chemotaxis transducer N-terminal domain-containing protein [Moraxellaceae bacterium]|nr:type IV pili methyl-accepting chemotaxis transducer N-terminal domain-containing protein [Moraxellaceae bacterium]